MKRHHTGKTSVRCRLPVSGKYARQKTVEKGYCHSAAKKIKKFVNNA